MSELVEHGKLGELNPLDDDLVIADEVCEKFLEQLMAQPGKGHVALMRELGVKGSGGQIRAAIGRQLKVEIGQVRNDSIRKALYERGIDGVEEPIYWQGEQVGTIRRYSDRCLVALAGMTLPEARNQLDLNLGGADGGPVRVEVADGRVSTISGVLALAAALGVEGTRAGLDGGPDRRALPAASHVLPDPADDQ